MVGAVSCLAYIVTALPLAVAWALWMALGVLGTALGGWLFFAQKIHPQGWAGLVILLGGMILLYAG